MQRGECSCSEWQQRFLSGRNVCVTRGWRGGHTGTNVGRTHLARRTQHQGVLAARTQKYTARGHKKKKGRAGQTHVQDKAVKGNSFFRFG